MGLGTAQFGTDYGVTNRVGRLSLQEAERILRRAAELGVDLLDTAVAYGDSECVLGRLLWPGHPFRIVTKVPPLGQMSGEKASREIAGTCRRSLERLRQPTLYALLLHQASDLAPPSRAAVLDALDRAKDQGNVRKVGVSVYTAADIDDVLDAFVPDVVQLPINAVAQGLVHSGHIARLHDAGVEIHARSVFLQGVLLAEPDILPPYFGRFAPILERFRSMAREVGVSPLRLALNYVEELYQIHASIVGVTSVTELDQILDQAHRPLDRRPDWTALACSDDLLINPARWPRSLK